MKERKSSFERGETPTAAGLFTGLGESPTKGTAKMPEPSESRIGAWIVDPVLRLAPGAPLQVLHRFRVHQVDRIALRNRDDLALWAFHVDVQDFLVHMLEAAAGPARHRSLIQG